MNVTSVLAGEYATRGEASMATYCHLELKHASVPTQAFCPHASVRYTQAQGLTTAD